MVLSRKRNVGMHAENTPRSKRLQVGDFASPTGLFSPGTSASLKMLVMSLEEKYDSAVYDHQTSVVVSDGEASAENDARGSLLDSLPDDMLAECFFSGYLDQTDILFNVRRANKRMERVARESIQSLDLHNQRFSASIVENIVARFENLSKLDFSCCSEFTGACLMQLVPLAKTLRSLNLSGTCLTDADIINYFMAVDTYMGGPCGLEELHLEAKQSECMRVGITDSSVAKIATSCPNLKKLNLGWCARVSDVSIQCLSKCRIGLTDLNLALTCVSDKTCKVLSKMQPLTRLNLDATDVSDNGIQVLLKGNTESLEKLSIRFTGNFSMKTLHSLAERDPILTSIVEMSICDDVPEIMADKVLALLLEQN